MRKEIMCIFLLFSHMLSPCLSLSLIAQLTQNGSSSDDDNPFEEPKRKKR